MNGRKLNDAATMRVNPRQNHTRRIEDFDARERRKNCISMHVRSLDAFRSKIPWKMRIFLVWCCVLFICFILLRSSIVLQRFSGENKRSKVFGSHGKFFYLRHRTLVSFRLITVFHPFVCSLCERWWCFAFIPGIGRIGMHSNVHLFPP